MSAGARTEELRPRPVVYKLMRGDGLEIPYELQQPSEEDPTVMEPMPTTGFAIVGTVRKNGIVTASFTFEREDAAGTGVGTIAECDWPEGSYKFDWQWTDPAGVPKTFHRGEIQITEDQTKV